MLQRSTINSGRKKRRGKKTAGSPPIIHLLPLPAIPPTRYPSDPTAAALTLVSYRVPCVLKSIPCSYLWRVTFVSDVVCSWPREKLGLIRLFLVGQIMDPGPSGFNHFSFARQTTPLLM